MIGRIGLIGLMGLTWVTQAAEDFPPLFPFLISYDAPDNASSVAHLLDAPAGKQGFFRVENGHFVNDKGRVKLHATNLTGPANFPTHEQSDKVAARLARFGLNCVRLHYFDAEYGNFMTGKETGIFGKGGALPSAFQADPALPFRLAPEQVERQDYLIAALKKRGVYVNMNLHVARFPKGLSFFDPRMIASEKAYAKALLARVNPYTGLAYADDPCVAMVEINNENALFNNYHGGDLDHLPEPYAGEFRKQWNAWLGGTYGDTAAMRSAWKWVATPLGNEQIAEGGFAEPVAVDGKRWILSLGSASATAAAADGVFKIDVARGGDEFFPKLFRTVSVKKCQAYTLSLKIRRTKGAGAATLGLAVADAKDGWRSLGVHQTVKVGSAWKTLTFPFTAAEDSDRAQIQLTRFAAGAYEIDDLSFQSGATCALDEASRIEDGSVPVVKNSGFVPLQARRDFYRFLLDTERAYWTGIASFLKNELKVKVPISGTQLGYSPPQLQAELDYVDNHSYWCHPSVNPKWEIRNEAMVNSMGCILGLAGERVDGKPYTVSEYNHPFPNQYGAEGQPMLRAYGAFQGWDGVFEYTYNHSPDFEPLRNTYFFSMIARTEVLAHMPACAAMYLRGDVREAQKTVVGALDEPAYFDRLAGSKAISASIGSVGHDARLALVHRTAMAFTGTPGARQAGTNEGVTFNQEPRTKNQELEVIGKLAADAKVIASDTGELTWNRELPGKAYWNVNTPNTKLFSGFPEGREITLGGVRLAVGKTRLGWATVSLTSRQATGFGEKGVAASVLLAATGVAENEGTVLDSLGGKSAALSDRLAWGSGTVLVEGVPATLTLPSDPAKTKCFALDPRGERKGEVPVVKGEGGGSVIVIGPQYATVWYEVDVKQ
jgi:hypothetical protein